jgi:hypothetical protein
MALESGLVPPTGGEGMARRAVREQPDRAAIATVAADLAALQRMTGPELADRYVALYGCAPRSRNRDFLRKRLAWRIQELAEGGLSERTLARIEELGAEAWASWRRSSRAGKPQPATTPTRSLDPRLPAVGTVIARAHGGTEHRVTVVDGGFSYQGERYRSLSKIARVITGTPWNGYLFFFGRAHGTKGRAA